MQDIDTVTQQSMAHAEESAASGAQRPGRMAAYDHRRTRGAAVVGYQRAEQRRPAAEPRRETAQVAAPAKLAPPAA